MRHPEFFQGEPCTLELQLRSAARAQRACTLELQLRSATRAQRACTPELQLRSAHVLRSSSSGALQEIIKGLKGKSLIPFMHKACSSLWSCVFLAVERSGAGAPEYMRAARVYCWLRLRTESIFLCSIKFLNQNQQSSILYETTLIDDYMIADF